VVRPCTRSRLSPPRMSSPSWGAPPGARHHRDRGGQAERAGAGDDQDATAGIRVRHQAAPEGEPAARVKAAIARITGTNTAEIRSASRCDRDFSFCAASTRAMIWPSTVSAPVRVTRMISGTGPFTVRRSARRRGACRPAGVHRSASTHPRCRRPLASSPSAGMACNRADQHEVPAAERLGGDVDSLRGVAALGAGRAGQQVRGPAAALGERLDRGPGAGAAGQLPGTGPPRSSVMISAATS